MISPKSVTNLRCYKNLSIATKSLIGKFDEERILIGIVAEIFNGEEVEFAPLSY